MATLYIEEYAAVGASYSAVGPWRSALGAAQEPSNAAQTIALTGSSTQCSTAFQASTQLIRVHTDAICSIALGLNPTAVTTSKRLAANQTEYFGVRPGDKIAAIVNT